MFIDIDKGGLAVMPTPTNPSTNQALKHGASTIVSKFQISVIIQELKNVIEAAGLTLSSTVHNQLLQAITLLSTPTATILDYAGATAPTGFLMADGVEVSRTTYARLFGIIGITYGAGNGTTTFNLPDARGRVVIGIDGSANRMTSASKGGANADTLGGTGGSETHLLTLNELPKIAIRDQIVTNGSLLENAIGGDNYDINFRTIGSDDPHSNTQPWIALNKIIRA
jgi:microcystin-dependent protein